MIDEPTKLILALHQVEGIIKLTKGNEYEKFIFSRLSSVKYELERQLTNLSHSSKIKE